MPFGCSQMGKLNYITNNAGWETPKATLTKQHRITSDFKWSRHDALWWKEVIETHIHYSTQQRSINQEIVVKKQWCVISFIYIINQVIQKPELLEFWCFLNDNLRLVKQETPPMRHCPGSFHFESPKIGAVSGPGSGVSDGIIDAPADWQRGWQQGSGNATYHLDPFGDTTPGSSCANDSRCETYDWNPHLILVAPVLLLH